MLVFGYLLYLDWICHHQWSEHQKTSGFKQASLWLFLKEVTGHLKFDIAGFIVQILCKLFILSSLQLNAYHTHMLVSHSRQPLAIWIIRVCELDIYVLYICTDMYISYMCHGDAGRFWWAHQGCDLSPKCNSSLNGSGPCLSNTRFDEHRVMSHPAGTQATQRFWHFLLLFYYNCSKIGQVLCV